LSPRERPVPGYGEQPSRDPNNANI
jgi:hypothetical protein